MILLKISSYHLVVEVRVAGLDTVFHHCFTNNHKILNFHIASHCNVHLMLWSSSSVQPCLSIVSGRAALNSAGCRKSTTFCDLSYLTIYNLDVKLCVNVYWAKRTSLSYYLSDTSLSFWTSCATLASTPLASSAIVKPSSAGALLSLEATTALLLACLWFPTCNCSLRRPTLLMPCLQSQDVSHTQWFGNVPCPSYKMPCYLCLAVTLDYWTTPWNLLLPRAQTSFYTDCTLWTLYRLDQRKYILSWQFPQLVYVYLSSYNKCNFEQLSDNVYEIASHWHMCCISHWRFFVFLSTDFPSFPSTILKMYHRHKQRGQGQSWQRWQDHSCFPARSLPVWHGGHLRQLKLERRQRIRWMLGRRRTDTKRITPASSGSFLKSRKG